MGARAVGHAGRRDALRQRDELRCAAGPLALRPFESTPRTFKFTEIVLPDSGYVLGVDSNGRNAQSQKMNPPAHSMSGLRLATTQRETMRATASGLLLEMRNNPGQVRPAV